MQEIKKITVTKTTEYAEIFEQSFYVSLSGLTLPKPVVIHSRQPALLFV
jgi:hypothetical protein